MRKPTNDRRGPKPAALWSGLTALWRVGARCPSGPLSTVWPLLVALLLWVAMPFAAPPDCSLEMGEHSHGAAQHHHDGDADPHDSADPHDTDHHASAFAHLHGAALQAPASCCSCSSESLNLTAATLGAPHHFKADSSAVVYAAKSAAPLYRFDALRGLNTRAGPPDGKPQRLYLAHLIGRAPPTSL